MKPQLRFALAALVLLAAADASAQQNPPASGQQIPFAQRKQMVIARISQEVTIIQQFSSCVNSAQNDQALHACREQRRQAEMQLRQRMGE